MKKKNEENFTFKMNFAAHKHLSKKQPLKDQSFLQKKLMTLNDVAG